MTARDGKKQLIAAESGTGTMAAIRINNNCTAEGNLGITVDILMREGPAGMHNHAKKDGLFTYKRKKKKENKPETHFS